MTTNVNDYKSEGGGKGDHRLPPMIKRRERTGGPLIPMIMKVWEGRRQGYTGHQFMQNTIDSATKCMHACCGGHVDPQDCIGSHRLAGCSNKWLSASDKQACSSEEYLFEMQKKVLS